MIEFISLLFLLMMAFHIKHFLADYIFQTEYHLGKFKETGWAIPLASHCGVHFVFTFVLVMIAVNQFDMNSVLLFALFMAMFDFIIHFVMDRIKASPNLLGKFKPNQKEFWWSLGLDQMVHHITDSIIVVSILFFIYA